MGRFLDVLKDMKHAGPMPQVCPSCGSTRIRQHGSLNGWLLPAVYVCEDCGYTGKFVLELDAANQGYGDG
jgi:predicted RNA-binding Zn-ribbon protein involved in translation (DUF1610 family)